jgi:outer membrane biogenesis lipoprotein LolB
MKQILAALTLCLLTACATPRQGQTVEIRAEQVLAVSLSALDSFVAFEHRRRAEVPPLVRDVAARVRLNAPKAMDSANALRLAYKGNRTAQNEASLFTALAVVDSLVGEIRVWVPATSASGPDNRVVDRLIQEAQASKTVTAQSWTVLVPVFIDLAKEIYLVVNRTREAVKQDAEWSLAEEADFAVKLAGLKTAPHWRL